MKRGLIILVMFMLMPFFTHSVFGDEQQPPRKKVGLVLSGGGAKGVAHVGVLKVLEKAGIPIDYIAGTSMGAIVGGLYAIGYTTDELDSLVSSQNWADLLGDKLSRNDKLYSERLSNDTYLIDVPLSTKDGLKVPAGILPGQNVLNMLNELTIGYHNVTTFDSLPIPFACVSYDMVKGQEYVARSGSLPTAIRASMSIPGAFTPVMLDSMLLVDGGVKNNFPVDVVLDMGADIVIGVDVSSENPSFEELNSASGMLDQMLTLISSEKYDENLKHVDLYIHPEIEPYSTASFTPAAVDSLLLRGERKACEQYDEILALKEKIGVDEDFVPEPVKPSAKSDTAFYVGDIIFDGLTGQQSSYMMNYVGLTPHSIITRRRLNDVISKMRGAGPFSYVTYTLDNQPPYNLTIHVVEKVPAILEVGFRFDSEELASILVNTTLWAKTGDIYSPKAGLTVRLSSNPYAKLSFDSGRIGFANINLHYMFRHNDFTVYQDGVKNHTSTFNLNQVGVALSNMYIKNFNASLGVKYEHYNYDTFLYVENDFNIPVTKDGYIDYYASLHYDSFDDAYYPTRGFSLKTDYTVYTDNGVQFDGGNPFSAINYSLSWAKSLGSHVTLLPSVYGRTIFGGDPAAYPYLNYMGGYYAGRYMEQQLPFIGIQNVEIFNNSVFVARLDVRTRLWKNHFLSLKCNYALISDKFFSMFDFREQIIGYGLEYSYKTPLGPISLLISGHDDKWGGVFFNFGKYF